MYYPSTISRRSCPALSLRQHPASDYDDFITWDGAPDRLVPSVRFSPKSKHFVLSFLSSEAADSRMRVGGSSYRFWYESPVYGKHSVGPIRSS